MRCSTCDRSARHWDWFRRERGLRAHWTVPTCSRVCLEIRKERRMVDPNEFELAEMRSLVEQAMKDGAFGLSTGLIYPPGCYADIDELIDLCRVVARYGGIYATHMRNEGENLLIAVDEAI